MPVVLIVDDERAIRDGLVRVVQSIGHEARTAGGCQEARAALRGGGIDVVLLDVRMKDGDGLDLLREIRAGLAPDVPVIMATAYGDSDRTIGAMKAGAFEYVTKPFDLPSLLAVLERALRQRRLASKLESSPPPPEPAVAAPSGTTLVGASAAMLGVWKLIGRAAASDEPVLVTGETGTGKELVARAVHEHSARAREPFIAVNLAALPESLLESELLGHEKGAFTGAATRRPGRLELAGSGTLFLDEIGDFDAALQTKLLRVLADGRYERVGGSETLVNRARIVAATNKPVRPGQPGASLREDLYYRLAVIEIHVPPLRERRSDIPLLVAHALAGTTARAMSEEAMALVSAYDWPGNVRELVHVVRRAAVVSGSEVIDVHDLPETLAVRQAAVAPEALPELPLREALAALEKQMILRALERAAGNRAEAARILGIARPQLYTKMEEHGIATRSAGKPDPA